MGGWERAREGEKERNNETETTKQKKEKGHPRTTLCIFRVRAQSLGRDFES